MRLYEAPEPGVRYPPRPGAYVILPRGPDMLAVATDSLLLPGGGIDPGESPLQALHREVMEETGWIIARPRRITGFRRFVWMPDYKRHAEKLCHIFVAHPVRRATDPIEPDHTPVWLRLRDAPDLLAVKGEADALRSWLRQVGRGRFSTR